MLLTDEEIESAVKTGGVSWTGYREDSHGFYTIPILSPYHYQFAHAIEAAVIAKLCASVEMPEAKFAYEKATDGVQGTHFYEVINPKAVPIWAALFTADQLRTVAAAARLKALEDAANVAVNGLGLTTVSVASRIRALKGAA